MKTILGGRLYQFVLVSAGVACGGSFGPSTPGADLDQDAVEVGREDRDSTSAEQESFAADRMEGSATETADVDLRGDFGPPADEVQGDDDLHGADLASYDDDLQDSADPTSVSPDFADLGDLDYQVAEAETPPVPPEPAFNYYGFVTMAHDKPLEQSFDLIRSVGAGWSQSEGPKSVNQSACWGLIEPGDGSYDFSTLDWIETAHGYGLDVLLRISSGNDVPGTDFYSPNVQCDPPLSNPDKGTSIDCPPKDYNHWYQFVYRLVEHFDGAHGAPEVRFYHSVEEAGSDVNYYRGSKESLYGGAEKVIIHRNNGLGDTEVLAAWIPVARLAIHDANPRARLIAGACTDYLGYPWNQLYRAVQQGAASSEVLALAASYGIPGGYQYILNTFNDPKVRRAMEFCEQSFLYPETYDAYGVHFYHPLGHQADPYQRVLSYVSSRFRERGIEMPLWVTGTGAFAQDSQARTAYYVFKTLVASYATDVVWYDFSFLSDMPPFVLKGKTLFGGFVGLFSVPDANGVRTPDEAAHTFSTLARIFPTYQSFEPVAVFHPHEDLVLYQFRVHRGAVEGFAAMGWCLNETLSALAPPFVNPDCPKSVDVAPLLQVPANTAVARYNYQGQLEAACVLDTVLLFDEAPFLLTWGPDSDGDCVPDVSDE